MDEDPEFALPCIVCGKGLKNLYGDNLPDDGIVFSSHGNYGSQVFDPMDSTFLEINICDKCITQAANLNRVALGESFQTKHYQYEKWKGN